jgi:integrase
MSLRTPKYRLHKGSGQALVQINGKRVYLGKYGTEQSKERYRKLVAEWLASGQRPAVTSPTVSSRTTPVPVNELILAFWQHAQTRYVKNGQPTSEICSYKTALKPVRRLYGQGLVTNFGPLALVACRQQLIDAGICRKRINQHVTRIRHVFKWGVAHELVPETIWRALCSIEGLRFGEAVETKPVKPVPEQHVDSVKPHVTPQIWGMVNLQLWTGCRPGEACLVRGIDLKMQGNVWEYRPHSHKTEHHEKVRVIYLGPQAQAIIKPWLRSDLYAYLFSPREAREWYQNERARNRRTPRSSADEGRKRRRNPKRAPAERYSTRAYDHAISRACKRAEVPAWTPNQLRHNAATRIRGAYGIEAARVILGHSSAVTSEIYAEVDREKAQEIMRRIG